VSEHTYTITIGCCSLRRLHLGSLLEQILEHSRVTRTDDEHNAVIQRIRTLNERIRVAADRAADNSAPGVDNVAPLSLAEARVQLQTLLVDDLHVDASLLL
jgi:hypothetical protein